MSGASREQRGRKRKDQRSTAGTINPRDSDCSATLVPTDGSTHTHAATRSYCSPLLTFKIVLKRPILFQSVLGLPSTLQSEAALGAD